MSKAAGEAGLTRNLALGLCLLGTDCILLHLGSEVSDVPVTGCRRRETEKDAGTGPPADGFAALMRVRSGMRSWSTGRRVPGVED